ncbi:MAG: DnaJ domain-containing protein [Deltaproteobacteria bacterium]|nr:DnaJ domain-containing protein [Deltaproteobacteria bacterium]
MKSDSSLFDRIRVKPDKDRRPKTAGPVCQWHGCKEKATNKAPKARGTEKEYWNFCIKHVREYNQTYNFFSGMSDAAVMAFQKDAITGHRPTWKMGTGKRNVKPDLSAFGTRGDPFGLFDEGMRNEQKQQTEKRQIRNAERKALDRLGLDVGATPQQVKIRFKELVKQFHPDANGGDRSTEDRLVEVIQSYNYLKSAGFG